MSAAAQIIDMVKRDPLIKYSVVADQVGCHPAYVRSALRRAGMTRSQSRVLAAAAKADATANQYEAEARAAKAKQVRRVPEEQLAELKAKHWRILAKWLREGAR
jgi:hypothetical protein